ncbi:MAG: RnfABCDGE type electron transport complex subunit G [Bacteroidales bacterium]|jgi:electron transport complex protein RnfG|nr:RnfABCDGE type electron transport complex subunit G [Bacteroidales bacterium]
MAKLQSSLKNMILCLFLISLVMSAALGVVYNVTKGPIEISSKKAEIDALKAVLPAFDNDPTADAKDIEGLTYYIGKKSETVVGYAVKTFTDKGFSGHFELMVGLMPDGSINKIAVLSQKETPGLGDKMKTNWKDQFNGKNPKDYKLLVKKDGGDVDAITASTISSRAFCDATQKAYDGYMKNFNKSEGGNQ